MSGPGLLFDVQAGGGTTTHAIGVKNRDIETSNPFGMGMCGNEADREDSTQKRSEQGRADGTEEKYRFAISGWRIPSPIWDDLENWDEEGNKLEDDGSEDEAEEDDVPPPKCDLHFDYCSPGGGGFGTDHCPSAALLAPLNLGPETMKIANILQKGFAKGFRVLLNRGYAETHDPPVAQHLEKSEGFQKDEQQVFQVPGGHAGREQVCAADALLEEIRGYKTVVEAAISAGFDQVRGFSMVFNKPTQTVDGILNIVNTVYRALQLHHSRLFLGRFPAHKKPLFCMWHGSNAVEGDEEGSVPGGWRRVLAENLEEQIPIQWCSERYNALFCSSCLYLVLPLVTTDRR